MRIYVIILALALPATAGASEKLSEGLSECETIERICETGCLNLDEGTADAQVAACYTECESKAQTCSASEE